MTELWLNFRDETGESRRVAVDRNEFVIGRNSDNDLVLPLDRLSRHHAKIERFAGKFSISDLGSSNGTNLNGTPVFDPVDLSNGDVIDLGGGASVTVEIVEVRQDPIPAETPADPKSSTRAPASNAANSATSNTWLLVIPLLGLFAFVCAGGGYFLFKKSTASDRRPTVSSDEDEDAAESSKRKKKDTEEISSKPDSLPSPPPAADVSSDVKKAEQNASAFLRKTAVNDPTAFITTKQAEMVSARIVQMKGSQGLAENLKAAKRASAEIDALAGSQGLKGTFLAAAALTKLGQSKGDPVATAKAMLPILGELRISLGNSLGDDNLLIIADFLRREGGRKPSLQTTLEALGKTRTGTNPREIRTIWFLKENGKISDESFEFALKFLAMGSIMQNPKDFGITADAF